MGESGSDGPFQELFQSCPDLEDTLRRHLVAPLVRALYRELRTCLVAVGACIMLLYTLFVAVIIYMLTASRMK